MPDQFGRLPSPEDNRDLLFGMQLHLRMLTGEAARPRQRMWRAGTVDLDQGLLGACVGFAGANWLQNTPVRTRVMNSTGQELYWACKARDGLPPGTEGTYVRVLASELRNRGLVGRYLWAESPKDLLEWVCHVGPVIMGTDWWSGMSILNSRGEATRTGQVIGGHAYLVRGYELKTARFRCVNSWGRDWGMSGEFWLRAEDLFALLAADGEAIGMDQIA